MEDWDNFEEQTAEELRRSSVKDFWDRNEKKCEIGTQYRPLFKALLERVEAFAQSEGLDPHEFETKLWEAEEIIENITYAFKSHWRESPDNEFWFLFYDDQLTERPEEWNDDSPIDPSSLDTATARYLERPWLQINLLDWYILNAFIKDELLRLAAGIRTGTLFGQFNLAYALSGGSQLKMLAWKPVLAILKFLMNWILLPAIVAALFYFKYETAAWWVLGFFGVLVFFWIIFLPRRIMRWRALKKVKENANDILTRLIQIRVLCQNDTLNPTHLKNQIAKAEKEAPLLKPAVHAILDRAIERDPSVFTTGS